MILKKSHNNFKSICGNYLLVILARRSMERFWSLTSNEFPKVRLVLSWDRFAICWSQEMANKFHARAAHRFASMPATKVLNKETHLLVEWQWNGLLWGMSPSRPLSRRLFRNKSVSMPMLCLNGTLITAMSDGCIDRGQQKLIAECLLLVTGC